MLAAALLALALAAPPELRLEGAVPAAAAREAEETWRRMEAALAAAGRPALGAPRPVRVFASEALPPGASASSRPGAVALRAGLPEPAALAALRHEVAHQLLFETCPAASSDRLFHEAFALAASGEVPGWERDGYLSVARALELLSRGGDLDRPAARRAIARLVSEGGAGAGGLPRALASRLSRCDPGARWLPLSPEDLAAAGEPAADALLLLSRHSGEVERSEGATRLAMPVGSTLKPLLLAGASSPPPALGPDPSRVEWRCGEGVPGPMDAATALLRSCNGWFLDWLARDPDAARFGRFRPALAALGFATPGAPADAIGLRPSLRVAPLALAQAYRLLAEARPDLLDVLGRNAREGTLAGAPGAAALRGIAAKTGTVLDAEGRPRIGWIAAVDGDHVLVLARAGRAPRTFAAEAARILAAARTRASGAVRVQVLGLVGPGVATARCDGVPVTAAAAPVLAPRAPVPVADLVRGGSALCLGGPWLVGFPGLAAERTYAGVLEPSPAPPYVPPPGVEPDAKQVRARRGSDVVFRTTRLLYAAGVVRAEDARLAGEPRIALVRVIAHDAERSRHPGRPVCDTTHCQVFQGTAPPSPEDRAALAAPPFSTRGWLPFSRGGEERWREARPAADVERVLGPAVRDLAFRARVASFTVRSGEPGAPFEERRRVPCEALRGPLRLPSCPDRAKREGPAWRFEGRGAGHGEGIDVEWARRSGRTADEILRAAYGELP